MMLKMVHDRIATGVTRVVSMAAILRCGNQWKNCHIITFPGQSLSKNRDKCEMLPLETRQTEGKLLSHFDLWVGSVFRGNTIQKELQQGLQNLEMNVEKTKVIRMSKAPSALQIVID